jgi:hypothetical protein
MGEFLLGCSGWNYGDTPDKGGWVGVFYPDKDTKRLRYYSQFFNKQITILTYYIRSIFNICESICYPFGNLNGY